jgi:hypothetical protein
MQYPSRHAVSAGVGELMRFRFSTRRWMRLSIVAAVPPAPVVGRTHGRKAAARTGLELAVTRLRSHATRAIRAGG